MRAPEHPAYVWEAQRSSFTKLYMDEKRTLNEVQRLMQARHNFSATLRQYKRKIKQWGLEKTCKAIEKSQALIALNRLAISLDRSLVHKVNGKHIPAYKLARYARAKCRDTPNISKCVVKRGAIESHFSLQDSILRANIDPVCKLHYLEAAHGWLCLMIDYLRAESEYSIELIIYCRTTLSLFEPDLRTTAISQIKMTAMKRIDHCSKQISFLKKRCDYVDGLSSRAHETGTYETFLKMHWKFQALQVFLNDWRRIFAEFGGIINAKALCWHEIRITPESLHGLRQKPSCIIEVSDCYPLDEHVCQQDVSSPEIHDMLSGCPNKTCTLEVPQISDLSIRTKSIPETNFGSKLAPHCSESGLQKIPGSGFYHSKALLLCGAESEPNAQITHSDRLVDDSTNMEIDSFGFDLVNTTSRHSLSSQHQGTRAMAPPTSTLHSVDVNLTWESIDWPEPQDGPICDLEMYLDFSLWNDTQISSQIDWNPVPLLPWDNNAGTSAMEVNEFGEDWWKRAMTPH